MDETTDWEKIREQNMKAMQAFLDEEMEKPEMKDILQDIHDTTNSTREKKIRKRKSNADSPFVFTGSIPNVQRSSSRIANRKPEYTSEDLDDVETQAGTLKINKFMKDSLEMGDLDEIVFRPKFGRRHFTKRRAIVPFVAAEDVSESYIKKIAWRVINKEYCADGTSCHQCRQKTDDSKTYCRSGRCIGIRGQFCGVCLKNRYGEDAALALKDPKWACPPCRNLCNCSICRTRQGKRPTGILAPVAQNKGFRSVADFLKHLQTVDNTIEPADEKKPNRMWDCDLLGFDVNGEPVLNIIEE